MIVPLEQTKLGIDQLGPAFVEGEGLGIAQPVMEEATEGRLKKLGGHFRVEVLA